MIDLLISGGHVVDGSGGPQRRADVGIDEGRIVAVGEVDEMARRTLDVTDLVVAPGFVDIHTHYDAQAFWDPTLSPSPLHGVTTVVGGNCGFTIAPLEPEEGDYVMRMLARVEGMPLKSLQQGVPWDWRSTREYLDRLDGGLTPNAGFLVGHSALRRAVMHDEAVGEGADPEQVEAMKRLLGEGLAAGALGFSSTWSPSHNDHEGNPVPSRYADRAELLALCSVVAEHPGTTLEFIPGLAPFDDDLFRIMGMMSATADRPLNWNALPVYSTNRELVDHQLAGHALAAEEGGKVLALMIPDSLRLWLNFKSGFILDVLPGWDHFMALPDDEKIGVLSDPERRAEMDRMAQTAGGTTRTFAHWARYVVVETASPETERFRGREVGEIAEELGTTPWDALADIVVADHLATVITKPDPGQDRATWERRVEVARDSRTVVGASDAGAHLDMIDTFAFATTLIARAVREFSLMSLEEAVWHLTDVPARLYGLEGRGRIGEGCFADLVVFDPETVAPQRLSMRTDLPGGGGRLFAGADGMHHVFVRGVEAVTGQEVTDARPGRILRSRRDTTTVRPVPTDP